MNKNDPKFRRFANLQGHLQKLSSNFLLGYQPKFWKVIDNGTKVGYSNEPSEPIKAQNLFLIKECFASEASGNTIFQLQTRDRVFMLRAPNEEERTDWIKGLTFLKKVMNNQVKLKNQISPTQTTIASRSQKLKTKKTPVTEAPIVTQVQKPRGYQPEDLQHDTNIQSDLVEQLIKFLPQKCLKYYTLMTNLKVKSQGLFIDSFNSHTYLLISPKSLYPDIYIGQQNLTNLSLPPWLQVNYFYKITSPSSNSKQKQRKKQIFHISKLIDIQEGSQKNSIKINTGQIIYQFFTETADQKECLQNCLQIAAANATEVVINGKVSKKNYDRLVELNETKIGDFEAEVKKIIMGFLGDPVERKYQPSNLVQFMESSLAFLREFILILEHKKKNKDHVILDVLKLFHEEVKTQTKLTWDSSFFQIKGIDILNILKKLSEYYDLMKNFIKSAQFLEGMKELSKIYVRESWKNFQSIIMSIVQQQKGNNSFEDEYCEYLQTHGVTDLFKFIYNVFDLAYPHWKNKIHLHNVNRLMQRALQVFVHELRSMIDEEVIAERQMVGLANNYFGFQDHVKEFYTEKFQELVEKTHQGYDKITGNYRELSMIILEKLASGIGASVEHYLQKCTIQTVKGEALQQILYKSLTAYEKLLHMAFLKKLYEKVSKEVHLKLCLLISSHVQSKKKLKLKQIIRCVKDLRSQLNKIFDSITKGHAVIDKKMEQLEKILSFDLYSDIEAIMVENSEPLKGIYMRILELREDFYQGSALMRIINEHGTEGENPETKPSLTKVRGSIEIREKNATISKQYFQEEIMDSDENSNGDQKPAAQNRKGRNVPTAENKLISQGYLTKGKRNHKVWQKQYFRLKNGFLYIFQTPDSQRCRNSVQITQIISLTVPNPQKPSFLLTYKTLNKQKQIKLKAESIELRDRWVGSIQLEKKRMLNQEQVKRKAVKYRELEGTGRKKYQMIIDYEEAQRGKDYFSYS